MLVLLAGMSHPPSDKMLRFFLCVDISLMSLGSLPEIGTIVYVGL